MTTTFPFGDLAVFLDQMESDAPTRERLPPIGTPVQYVTSATNEDGHPHPLVPGPHAAIFLGETDDGNVSLVVFGDVITWRIVSAVPRADDAAYWQPLSEG